MPKMNKYATTLDNRDWVYQHYVVEGKNASEVARLIGCFPSAVIAAVKRFGFETKTMSEVIKKIPHPGSNAPRPRAEFKNTLHNREWLDHYFNTLQLSAAEIADMIGSSVTNVHTAILKTFGIDSTVRSLQSEEALEDNRARAAARRLYPNPDPCIICGDPDGTLNHIDANPRNNNPENLEWLCMTHHLMVDKRLTARASKWLRYEMKETWLEWHAEILEDVMKNPDQFSRKLYVGKKPPKKPDFISYEDAQRKLEALLSGESTD